MAKALSCVGFTSQQEAVNDKEICDMVDEVIWQVLGSQGLASIIKPGDKVVIKVNLEAPYLGERGEKGRGMITDPRIVRYVAEKVREIIGVDNGADLKVVDALRYKDSDPSLKSEKTSFYWAKLERTGDNAVDEEDVCYDFNANGILDGESQAQLVNLDAIGEKERQLYTVQLENDHIVKVAFPKFLRTKEQAKGSDEYCDVFIGLPVFKSHGLLGIAGALDLHYGIRSQYSLLGDTGRYGHSTMQCDENSVRSKEALIDYLSAIHFIREYDFILMDCLTANRKGPTLPLSGVYTSNINRKADYIQTNALLASTDPVAIDALEVAFAGYKQSSISLLKEASENSLGENNPAYINLRGKDNFSIHRKYLRGKYSNRYPLEDGWGEARILESIEPRFKVDLAFPRKISDNIFCVSYKILRGKLYNENKLVRIEFTVSGIEIESRTEGNLESGEFLIDLNKYKKLRGTSLVCIVFAWDDTFNCVSSIERFIFD